MRALACTLALALLAVPSPAALAAELPALSELLGRTAPGGHVLVRQIAFEGEAVDEAELRRVAEPYVGRPLVAEDLVELRERVAGAEAAAGRLGSQVAIPAQDLERGVLRIDVRPGRLGSVEVEGARYFDPRHLADRLLYALRGPIELARLERELGVLQADPRIRAVHAQLVPGAVPGESRLLLQVEEHAPFHAALGAGNRWSPAVGETGAELALGYANLLGRGDELHARIVPTRGLRAVDLGYRVPLHVSGTELELGLGITRASVVEDPFDAIDIESSSLRSGLRLRQPLWRSERTELWVGISGELRQTRTELLGEDFDFTPGSVRGETRHTALRFEQEWITRSRSRVLALRSSLSLGVDALGATRSHRRGPQVAGPSFVYWLGQFQWAERLPRGLVASQLLLRADLQWSGDPLHPSEQMALGGSRTVRGYRRNRLVRDSGVALSLELRVPLRRSALGREILQLAPFVDFGQGWNRDRTPSLRSIASTGLGLVYRPSPRLSLSVYYGHRLRDVDRSGDALQDHGLHIETTWLAF